MLAVEINHTQKGGLRGNSEASSYIVSKTEHTWDFPGSQWLRHHDFTMGAWVQSLVGKLRSHTARQPKKRKLKLKITK